MAVVSKGARRGWRLHEWAWLWKLASIGLGGALGAVLRYGVSAVVQGMGGLFPLGTLAVNVLGCGCIGVLGGYFAGPHMTSEHLRLAVLVGVLGAFTTFSTFGWETVQLLGDGELGAAAVNIAANNLLGLVAVWLGYRVAVSVFGV